MTKEKKHSQRQPNSSAGQSGGDQGLPHDATADSESVEELLEEGSPFEAGVVFGVENSKDPSISEVTRSSFWRAMFPVNILARTTNQSHSETPEGSNQGLEAQKTMLDCIRTVSHS